MCRLIVGEECDATFNADVNGAENIHLNINENYSESFGVLSGDRNDGWLAQSGVHLLNWIEGPFQHVFDCQSR